MAFTQVEHAFDGFFYPMVLDGSEYEYIWDDEGDEVRFTTENEALAFLAARG
jgi:hypothetical protein